MKLKILPKRLDVLDALGNDNQFRINIDVLNECFGANTSLYMKACYPNNDFLRVKDNNMLAFVWMPKFYYNSSLWKNSISKDENEIYEIAETERKQDWKLFSPELLNKYRIVFVKETKDSWYRFVGVYKDYDMSNLKHTYKRVAAKIKLIGNPVYQIELLNEER